MGKGTEDLQAYLKCMQAREHFFSVTKEGNALAKSLAEEAILLDPEFAPAGTRKQSRQPKRR